MAAGVGSTPRTSIRRIFPSRVSGALAVARRLPAPSSHCGRRRRSRCRGSRPDRTRAGRRCGCSPDGRCAGLTVRTLGRRRPGCRSSGCSAPPRCRRPCRCRHACSRRRSDPSSGSRARPPSPAAPVRCRRVHAVQPVERGRGRASAGASASPAYQTKITPAGSRRSGAAVVGRIDEGDRRSFGLGRETGRDQGRDRGRRVGSAGRRAGLPCSRSASAERVRLAVRPTRALRGAERGTGRQRSSSGGGSLSSP